jgi:hypothetical protein
VAAKRLSFEQVLVEVWRQALVENAKVVVLGEERYDSVFKSSRKNIRVLS